VGWVLTPLGQYRDPLWTKNIAMDLFQSKSKMILIRCISNEMTIMVEDEEDGNVGSEHESVSSECMARWEK
jgi:hypothetical protein